MAAFLLVSPPKKGYQLQKGQTHLCVPTLPHYPNPLVLSCSSGSSSKALAVPQNVWEDGTWPEINMARMSLGGPKKTGQFSEIPATNKTNKKNRRTKHMAQDLESRRKEGREKHTSGSLGPLEAESTCKAHVHGSRCVQQNPCALSMWGTGCKLCECVASRRLRSGHGVIC